MKKSLLLFAFVACSAVAQVGSLGGSGIGAAPLPSAPTFSSATISSTGTGNLFNVTTTANSAAAFSLLTSDSGGTPRQFVYGSSPVGGGCNIAGMCTFFGSLSNDNSEWRTNNIGWLTLGVTGKLSSSKTCAANYTRVGPNFCLLTTAATQGSIGTTCTSIAAPANAIAVLGFIDFTPNSNNAIGSNSISVQTYNDATCVTPVLQVTALAREYVATAGAIAIGHQQTTLVLPVVSGNVVLKATLTNGGGAAVWAFNGYFD